MDRMNNAWLRQGMEIYCGLTNGCAPGVHAYVVQRMKEVVPYKSGVLDLGAGTGALLLRLRHEGFDDLCAADLAADHFGLRDTPFVQVDLNGDFVSEFDRKFNVVCMSEVVEHLDSPRSALSQARDLLKKDGYLVLTLPNVGFWEGRLKFLWKGELWGFGEQNYRSIRHVSPMTIGLLKLTLREMGFLVVHSGVAGSFATVLRRALFAPLWLPIYALGGPDVMGECIVIIAQKVEPDLELAISGRRGMKPILAL
jgi:2-polyprenyl-3-methyl-5-hydroxy-6-metoxy-1,4-benzoquinol methylase